MHTIATSVCPAHCGVDHIHLGPTLPPVDLREVLTIRPSNFDELVEYEKNLIRERGYIRALVGDRKKSEIRIMVTKK